MYKPVSFDTSKCSTAQLNPNRKPHILCIVIMPGNCSLSVENDGNGYAEEGDGDDEQEG